MALTTRSAALLLCVLYFGGTQRLCVFERNVSGPLKKRKSVSRRTDGGYISLHTNGNQRPREKSHMRKCVEKHAREHQQHPHTLDVFHFCALIVLHGCRASYALVSEGNLASFFFFAGAWIHFPSAFAFELCVY